MEFVGGLLSYAVPFVLVLTLVVTVHELGHFLVARAFGVEVDEFSIGFGRAIARWRDRKGVDWKIGWLPFGGYVRFAEDEHVTSVPDRKALDALKVEIQRREGPGAEKKYFHFKPLWQRALIVVAGPVANFLLAIALFAGLFGTLGELGKPPRVDGVSWFSPAERAGFQKGDIIVKADGRTVDEFEDIYPIVRLRAGTAIEFVVRRGDALVEIIATPERRLLSEGGSQQRVGFLGLQPPPDSERVRRRYGPVAAVGKGAERAWEVIDTTVTYLGRIVAGRESGDQLGGPIRIAKASGDVASAGANAGVSLGQKALGATIGMLGLAAVLSVAIGFMNLLPIPVLDGGHLLFYAYEAAARRPVGPGVQAASYRVGLALLLALMVFVTWNDLQQLRVFQLLGGLFS